MKKFEKIQVDGPVPSELEANMSALKWSLIGDVLSHWRENGPVSFKEETLIEADYVEAIGDEDGLHIVQDAVSEKLTTILADVKMIDAEPIHTDTVVVAEVLVDYFEDTNQAVFTLSVNRVEN